jgi:hypothetical protein
MYNCLIELIVACGTRIVDTPLYWDWKKQSRNYINFSLYLQYKLICTYIDMSYMSLSSYMTI